MNVIVISWLHFDCCDMGCLCTHYIMSFVIWILLREPVQKLFYFNFRTKWNLTPSCSPCKVIISSSVQLVREIAFYLESRLAEHRSRFDREPAQHIQLFLTFFAGLRFSVRIIMTFSHYGLINARCKVHNVWCLSYSTWIYKFWNENMTSYVFIDMGTSFFTVLTI